MANKFYAAGSNAETITITRESRNGIGDNRIISAKDAYHCADLRRKVVGMLDQAQEEFEKLEKRLRAGWREAEARRDLCREILQIMDGEK
jgi:hypothetical protein